MLSSLAVVTSGSLRAVSSTRRRSSAPGWFRRGQFVETLELGRGGRIVERERNGLLNAGLALRASRIVWCRGVRDDVPVGHQLVETSGGIRSSAPNACMTAVR